MTPPHAPVVLVADAMLQEEPMPDADRTRLRVPTLSRALPPIGDSGAVGELARMLVAAENPVIVAGRAARTPNGLALLVELAEMLQAPVRDEQARVQRMNFPSLHPLRGGVVEEADLVLGLEVAGLLPSGARADPGKQAGHGVAADHQGRREDRDDLVARAPDQEQLPGLRPLQRGRPGDRRRRRGDVAVADRGLQEAHHARPHAAVRAARRTAGRGGQGRLRSGDVAGGGWLGCEPHLHGAAVDGALEPDQERGLVAGLRRHVRPELAAAALGLRPSTTSTSAGPAPTASATAHRPRWVPRSPTGSTAG